MNSTGTLQCLVCATEREGASGCLLRQLGCDAIAWLAEILVVQGVRATARSSLHFLSVAEHAGRHSQDKRRQPHGEALSPGGVSRLPREMEKELALGRHT
ncbi:hypothetical protein MRX96_052399 [Rhipicephalus microplus]